MEAAEASTQQFNKGSVATVQKVGQQKVDLCYIYCCGRSNHTFDECRFKDATCRACKKKGHLASVCRSRKQGQEKPPKAPKKRYRKSHQTKWVQADGEESADDSEPELPMHKIGPSSTHPITVTLNINGK